MRYVKSQLTRKTGLTVHELNAAIDRELFPAPNYRSPWGRSWQPSQVEQFCKRLATDQNFADALASVIGRRLPLSKAATGMAVHD